MSAQCARSAQETWNPGGAGGGNGVWDSGTTANWNSGQVWADGSDALFTGTGGTVTAIAPLINSINFAATGPYLITGGTLHMTGTNLVVNSNATIASAITSTNGICETGAGTLTLTGSDNLGSTNVDVESGNLVINNGGLLSDNNGYLGDYAGNNSTAVVSGTGSSWLLGNILYVGNYGNGSLLIQNGAIVSATNFVYVGNEYGGNGSLTVSGSGSQLIVKNYQIEIGFNYTGGSSLNITSGGTVNAAGTLYTGTATISGSGSKWTTPGEIAAYNGGIQILNGGALSAASYYFGGVTISVSGSGSSFSASGNTEGGSYGDTILNISNGGLASLNNLYTNEDEGESTITVSGSESKLSAGNLYIGTGGGSSSLQITNAGTVSDNNAYLGGDYSDSGVGTATISGLNTYWSNTYLAVGGNGGGTLVISGSAIVSSSSGLVGTLSSNTYQLAENTSSATVTGSGSQWICPQLTVEGDGPTSLNIINGGTVFDTNVSICVSYNTSALVTVSGSGSLLTGTGGIAIGDNVPNDSGTGTLFIANGGKVNAGAGIQVLKNGTLALAGNQTEATPVYISDQFGTGGALSLVDGQLGTVNFTSSSTISSGASLSFDVGAGSDFITGIQVTGTALVNLYGLSGQVTPQTYQLVAGDTSGNLSLGNIYNSGNFKYSLLYTATSEDVVIAAAPTPLTTAYWKGNRNNIWSILVGGTASNWTTDAAGTSDPQLTPSSTTNVYFSASGDANDTNTLLGTDMTINSLSISDPNGVVISGSNPNNWLGTNTLTLSGNGTDLSVTSGAGPVAIGANLALEANQTWTNNSSNAVAVSGTISGPYALTLSGTGVMAIEGNATYSGSSFITNSLTMLTGTLGNGVASVSKGAALEVDGLLGGTATVDGTLTGIGTVSALTIDSDGTIAPGLSTNSVAPGILTAEGNVSLSASSVFSIRLGVDRKTDGDQLMMINGGSISLGDANLELVAGPAFVSGTVSNVYVIVNGGAQNTGTGNDQFAQGSLITVPSMGTFDILYASNAAGTGPGNDVVLKNVPEPGEWEFLLGGLGLLAGYQIRSRREPRKKVS